MDTFTVTTELYHKIVFRGIFGQLNFQVFGRRKFTFIRPSSNEQNAMPRTEADVKCEVTGRQVSGRPST